MQNTELCEDFHLMWLRARQCINDQGSQPRAELQWDTTQTTHTAPVCLSVTVIKAHKDKCGQGMGLFALRVSDQVHHR